MKSSVLLVIFSFCIFFVSCAAQNTASSTGVMFYNLENLYDTINDPEKDDETFLPTADRNWNAEKYHEKLLNIAKVITTAGMPVLVGVCEVENRNVLDDLIAEKSISEGNYKYIHFNSPDERGIDVALLYNAALFTPKKYFPITVNLPGETVDYTRDILFVYGELTINGKKEPLNVYVNHWPSRVEGEEVSAPKRAAAAQTLKKVVDSLFAELKNPNIIIMGDFNDTPFDKSISQILYVQELDADRSFERLVGLAFEKQKKGEGSYNYKGNWQALDQIIVSKSLLDGRNLDVEENTFEFFQQDFMMYNHPQYGKSPSRSFSGTKYYSGYSDHLPVYVELKLF